MTEQTTQKRNKLSYEILMLSAIAFAISFFLFEFLFLTANSIVDTYCDRNDVVLTYAQSTNIEIWIFSVSLAATVLFFIIFFLFLLGQKLSYIHNITKGVKALQTQQMDFLMPLEGNNELTQLAETINYLSASEKQIKEREQTLNEEKEQLIRSLSHDIRTPLTSILAYSDLLINQDDSTFEKQQEYLILIQKKAEQIKELTDVLLDGGKRNPEQFEDARLLFTQLAAEFEETLEDSYEVSIQLTNHSIFGGTFDVGELRRILNNLISNIQKYADVHRPVTLELVLENQEIVIRQHNYKRHTSAIVESHHMGINSIRRIALNYDGRTEILEDDDSFSITIMLSKF